METRELTYGEKAVGITFNPSNDPNVQAIKETCANVIDLLNAQRELTATGEIKAMLTIAIRDIQSGQMWGVKAVTWRD